MVNKAGSACPGVLRIDRHRLGPPVCRSNGRGIIDNSIAASTAGKPVDDLASPPYLPQRRHLRSLHLGGNPGIDEEGVLAVALKTAPRPPFTLFPNNPNDDYDIIYDDSALYTLDLSSCGIGDIRAEVLSVAIASNPG